LPYIDTSIRNFDISLEDFIKNLSDPNNAATTYNAAWNNFTNDDIGEAILKLLASFSHTVDTYRSHYLDNLYLPCNEPNALEQIYEMLNYKPGLKRSMVLSVNFVWKGCGPVAYVVIPKFFKLSITADGVDYNFLVLRKATYMPNSSRLYVDIVLGDLFENTMVASDIITNKVFVTNKDIDSESITFFVDGKEWSPVRNIYYEKVPEHKYSVHTESDGTYIYLPVNWMDYMPSEVSDILIQAALLKTPFDIQTADAVRICLLDALYCSLGDDVTSQFNVYLIKTLSSASSEDIGKRRIITLEDYEKEAKTFPGIVDARAYNWGDGGSLGALSPNMVRMVVVGDEGNISDFVKRGLKEFVDSLALPEIDFEVVDPVLNKIDLRFLVNIGTLKDTIFQAEIYQSIRTAILDYMQAVNMGIGKPLNVNELVAKVSRSDSRIKFIELRSIVNLYPKLNEIPILGNLIIDFSVESAYKYDTITAFEFTMCGPKGTDNDNSAEDILSDLVAYIYVGEDLYWDYIPEEAIYFEKEFIDEGTLSEKAFFGFDGIDDVIVDDVASLGYFSNDEGSVSESSSTNYISVSDEGSVSESVTIV